jgi:hypothetical protein
MNRSTAQPVCCNGDNFNGAVVVGCTPISVWDFCGALLAGQWIIYGWKIIWPIFTSQPLSFYFKS